MTKEKEYKLTIKQEAFCLAYIETNNASEAYRRAYDSSKMKPESVYESASRLLADVKITARLAELREPIMQRHNVTVDSLVLELEEARRAALSADTPQSSAAVAATMGKAKKWRATITVDGKQRSLGRHKNLDDAAKAYADASIKEHGEYAAANSERFIQKEAA